MTDDEKKQYIYNVVAYDTGYKKKTIDELASAGSLLFEAIPKHLYKYRSFGDKSYLEDYVRDNRIFISSIYEQNDRFEGITTATIDRIRESKEADLWGYYRRKIATSLISSFPSIKEETSKKLVSLFDDGDLNEAKASEVLSEEEPEIDPGLIARFVHSLSGTLKRFQHDTEVSKNVGKFIAKMIKLNSDMGIYSMSSDPVNDTMWAHYSDDFRGYVIEYDLTEPVRSRRSIKFVMGLLPVIYSDEKNDDWLEAAYLSFFKAMDSWRYDSKKGATDFTARLTRMLCTKLAKWTEEAEWRYLGKKGRKINGPLISSIIVGDKIRPEDLKKLITYIAGRYPLKIVRPNPTTKKLEMQSLDKKMIAKILGTCMSETDVASEVKLPNCGQQ